jgi:nitrate/TMAO reductase-like tetraheme cytochrome c subunit
MDEEQKDVLPEAPPRFRGRLIKVLTLTLFFLILLFSIGFLGLETTSSSKFCASCHEMKPEYYTWKASSHSEVDCVNCHTGSTKEDYAKAKANGLVQVFKKATQTYTAPIRMPDQIQDASCEKCHNIFTRDVTPTGDLIIPHDKHKKQGIKCAQCHQGVAHGKIADRKMTFQADYQKWNDKTGIVAMSEINFIKPDMDTCMDCHKARKVTTECTSCHTTGMFPKSHQKADFKLQIHGINARSELKDCNNCHKDMSEEDIEGYEEVPALNKILNKDKNQKTQKNHLDYAKENTFCRDCHSQRPPSHGNYFLKEHGELASKGREKCLACHEYQRAKNSSISQVSCSSCHPSSHTRNKTWRDRHPIPVAPDQKLIEFCYTCHSEPTCSSCHRDSVVFEKNEE